MADGSAPALVDQPAWVALLVPRRVVVDPPPTERTSWLNPPAVVRAPNPRVRRSMVGAAMTAAGWRAWRSRLPAMLKATVPSLPPKDEREAWAVMREALWARRREPLVPVVRRGRVVGAYAAPIERQVDELVRVCVRPAPIVKLESTRRDGWRYEPSVTTERYAIGPEGGAAHLGNDIASAGEVLARGWRRPAPTDRKGLPRYVGPDGSVVLMEARTVMVVGPDGELVPRMIEPEPVTWQERLMDCVRAAKARVLEWQANGGRDPRRPGGTAHPAHVLASVAVPEWITPEAVRYLVAVTSWRSGGRWQYASATITHALRSEQTFRRFQLRHIERVALSYYDPSPGADNDHACSVLVSAHRGDRRSLRERRAALIGRKPELVNLYDAAIVPMEPVRAAAENRIETRRVEIQRAFSEAQYIF